MCSALNRFDWIHALYKTSVLFLLLYYRINLLWSLFLSFCSGRRIFGCCRYPHLNMWQIWCTLCPEALGFVPSYIMILSYWLSMELPHVHPESGSSAGSGSTCSQINSNATLLTLNHPVSMMKPSGVILLTKCAHTCCQGVKNPSHVSPCPCRATSRTN